MKLVLGVMIGVFLALAAPVFAQGLPGPVPAPITVRNEITVQAPPPDPTVIAQSAQTSSESIVAGVIVPPLLQWANSLLDLPDIWRTTPPDLTYGNDTIRALAELVRLAAFALIALALLGVGISRALGGELQLGRVAFAAVMSAGNLVWWQIGIDINNAINQAIRAPDVKQFASPHLVMPTDPLALFGDVAMVLVFVVVLLLTLITLATRLGLIEVLIAAGSLALLCAATEQTAHWASGYAKVSAGTLFSQVLIVLGLVSAQVLGGIGTGVVGTLLAIVVLLLVRSLPGTLAGMGQRGGDTGMIGRLVQLAVFRRLAMR